ncbi:MAG: primosomal protein N' [Salibacteraceae bacterium]
MPVYIDVVLPLAIRGTYTYAADDTMADELVRGKRVVVSFGAKRLYTAIIWGLREELPPGTRPKFIEYIVDDVPLVTEHQLQLWQWMSEYYMCGPGMVMAAALPASLRLSSQTAVCILNENFTYEELTPLQRTIVSHLSAKRSVNIVDLMGLAGRQRLQTELDDLIDKGIVDVYEEVPPSKKPRQTELVRLSDFYTDESHLGELMNTLVNAPKQLEIIMRFAELSGFFNGNRGAVPLKRLLNSAKASKASLKSLVNKGVFETEFIPVDPDFRRGKAAFYELTPEQEKASKEVLQNLGSKPVLLKGVTGSGKTLVYARCINEVVSAGGQVLMLVPEITLTSQLISRLANMVSASIATYHSRLTHRERLLLWQNMVENDPPAVVVGARSAVFLPYRNLKLVIIDEEHETSYKQETAPSYNGRDVAIWLAHRLGAGVVLGSATPSVESYHKALHGKYALVTLNKRFTDVKMPLIDAVDLKQLARSKMMKGEFSPEVIDLIKQTISAGKQVIVFQNRRGFAPFMICEECGWSAECENCDVHLTIHKTFGRLVCHYCGYGLKQPTACPACSSPRLKIKGSGTEKLEEQLEVLLPEARLARMDLDTTRGKENIENIIASLEDGSVDILIGTQMVTKGLDFEHVNLVVVALADSLWNRPDFRAFERAYQLLTQVAGRAGRRSSRGRVVIQTYNPTHPVLLHAVANDYLEFYNREIQDREAFFYPPFCRLIRFEIAHKDPRFADEASQFFARLLKGVFGKNVLGPQEPPVARVRNKYLRQVFLKLDLSYSLTKSRNAIRKCIDQIEAHEEYRKIRLKVDVDPI